MYFICILGDRDFQDWCPMEEDPEDEICWDPLEISTMRHLITRTALLLLAAATTAAPISPTSPPDDASTSTTMLMHCMPKPRWMCIWNNGPGGEDKCPTTVEYCKPDADGEWDL